MFCSAALKELAIVEANGMEPPTYDTIMQWSSRTAIRAQAAVLVSTRLLASRPAEPLDDDDELVCAVGFIMMSFHSNMLHRFCWFC